MLGLFIYLVCAITFTRKRTEITIQATIRGHPIPWVNQVKYLGLILDKKLTWTSAIEARIKLAYPALRRMYPLIAPNSALNRRIKVNLYKICIRPIITYGHQVWAAAGNTQIHKVQKIQNKFLRIILNKTRRTKTDVLHKAADIPKITEFIKESMQRAYNHQHHNPLIAAIGDYNIEKIPLKVKVKLPKHAAE